MKKYPVRLLAPIAILFAWLSIAAAADTTLPSIFTDHMVLQRDQPIPVWGWDDPLTEVRISINGSGTTATTDADGKWLATLEPMAAGGPHELTIEGSTSVTLTDVLIGEVWLCSGQSNMEWPVRASANPEEEIAAANHPQIRHIKIPHTPAATPQSNVESSGWQVCSPDTVASFTAVGYFFGRELHDELNVPIGLIGSNWGGTRIEPWTPPAGFKQVDALSDISSNIADYPEKREDGMINHQSATALYNGMISPLVPYAIRGAIWYQGESNNGEGMLYHEKMKALIAGWRSLWQRDDLPFYYVQLAPFRYGGEPTRLPGIWEAQLKTLAVPHTGMAVTTDISNLGDIHPKNKQDVGKRLALWALAKNYGREAIVFSSPLYKSMSVEGDRIRLHFEHIGSGLVSRDDKPLNWFTIAGEDGQFVEATATIDGDTVVVQANGVPDPVAVRFGWHQEAEPNLANSAGLPASPFRTDDT